MKSALDNFASTNATSYLLRFSNTLRTHLDVFLVQCRQPLRLPHCTILSDPKNSVWVQRSQRRSASNAEPGRALGPERPRRPHCENRRGERPNKSKKHATSCDCLIKLLECQQFQPIARSAFLQVNFGGLERTKDSLVKSASEETLQKAFGRQ